MGVDGDERVGGETTQVSGGRLGFAQVWSGGCCEGQRTQEAGCRAIATVQRLPVCLPLGPAEARPVKRGGKILGGKSAMRPPPETARPRSPRPAVHDLASQNLLESNKSPHSQIFLSINSTTFMKL
ncbi:hypothetical protein E2C01_063327 [Portunus trituberculatus]|uniref:Uncharacterized protein n=1 Tax=Portunus trituberculatus TaxID=210409 RepID=A0A5B7HDD6_PORTR|nr:hypothetical protein [Portunus trituberculatus]